MRRLRRRRHEISGYKTCYLCGCHSRQGIWSEHGMYYCRTRRGRDGRMITGCWELLQESDVADKPRSFEEAEQERFEQEESECNVQSAEGKEKR